MVTRKPYHAGLHRLTSVLAWCVAVLVSAGLLTVIQCWQLQRQVASLPISSGNVPRVFAAIPADDDSLLPHVLSKKDVLLYQRIFQAQRQSDWEVADHAIAMLHNPMLLGYVLAERYLDRHYNASRPQLVDWLIRYPDYPQTTDIYDLAIAKAPSIKNALSTPRKQIVLSGYGDDKIVTASPGDQISWNAGINAWRIGHKAEAAKLFSGMVQRSESLPPPMTSAAAYWAYRCYRALGNHPQADLYLHIAANDSRNFYGILARRQLKQSLTLDNSPPPLNVSDILEMINEPAVRRSIALVQIGEPQMAEQELRTAFPAAPLPEKFRLLALARQLNLASVQIGMAKLLSHDGQELDFARYPIPDLQPDGGFKVDPALMFALMRQESGFNAAAVSRGGALGLMQLMPQTASLMRKSIGYSGGGKVTEPVLNITLGQSYIHQLLDSNLVQGNLFYLLAAYNAGPGRLQEWKNTLGHDDDPLLFVESIPYSQTRHYVMQVMTNYWIYSELIGTANHSAYALLGNHWPSYDAYIPPVAEQKMADNVGG